MPLMKLSDRFATDVEAQQTSYLGAIFEEEPVPLDVFVEDRKYLGNPPLSPVQFELVRHIERVYLPSLYPLMAEEFGGYWADPVRMTNIITAQWGKGAGKDHTVRVASLRVAYLLMVLKSPQRYYAMPEQDSIHLLNIAYNAGQANRAFFKPMTVAVNNSPWFKDRSEPKRDVIQYAKNIEAVSGHSEAEGQEGLNLMLGVADEIDAFKSRAELVGQGKKAREASTTAESILEMMKTSASTRFPSSYKRVAISYPRYLGSTIQKLTLEGRADIEEVGEENSPYYVSGPLATWEVNPRVEGKHQFASDYRKNPDEAAAKYECKPSRAVNAYFRNPQIFRTAVDKADQPVHVEYETVDIIKPISGEPAVAWQPKFHFDDDFQPVQGARYAIHGDLAIKNDRAGIAMSHVEAWTEQTIFTENELGEPVEESMSVPIIRNDFTIAFEADIGATPPREIQIRWVRLLIFELIKRGFFIAQVSFDSFQSTDTMQILESHGIAVEKLSPDKDTGIWRALKDLGSDGRLRMPWNEVLQNEIEALSDNDGKVDHPPGGSKDLADAFACSLVGAVMVGGEEDEEGTIVDVGEPYFELGPQVAGFEGDDEIDYFLGGGLTFPIGMTGTDLYGRE